MIHRVKTGKLEIAYRQFGPDLGPAVILCHGWPSDVGDWDEVAEALAAKGWRVLVPWLRGFGPTRFLDGMTPRSGQQGALGADLRDFMDALGIPQAILAGYDWGGRAACIVAALWPERVRGLVSITGYNIQNIALADLPDDPAQEHRYWYQWYFHTDRGCRGLEANRNQLCRLLWQLWSPNWAFAEETYATTAKSFANPDFVDVTIQSYRHRYGQAAGDPDYDQIERQLAAQPVIAVPSIILHGLCDGVTPACLSDQAHQHFTNRYERRLFETAGHFLSREQPQAVVEAILDLS
jgi:pimeloyl-ACP methyl ester carboxylesterase